MAENFIQAALDKTSSLNKPAPRPTPKHLYPPPPPQQCAASILQSIKAHQHRSIPKLAQHSKKTDAAALAARATDAAAKEKESDGRDKIHAQPQRQDGSQSDKIDWEYWYSTAIGYFTNCQNRLGCDITPENCDFIRTQLSDTTALNAAIAANSRLFAAINDSLQIPEAVDGATSARPSAAAGDQKKVEEVGGVGPVKEGGVVTRMKTERKAESDATIKKLETRIWELEREIKIWEARFIPGLKEAHDQLWALNVNLTGQLAASAHNLDQTTKERDTWSIKASFNKSAFITARKEHEIRYYQLQASLQSIAELTRRNNDLAVRHAEVSGRATKAEQEAAELQAQFARLTADRDGFAMQITQLNTDAANNTSSIADKEHAIGRADTEIARLRTEVSDLRARLRAADVSLETSKSTVADRERELTTARIQTMSYTTRLEISTAHTESQDKQIATLQSTVASRDVQISHLSTENAVLVDRHASRAEEAAGYLETLKARIEDVTRLQRAGTDAAVKLAEAEQREAGARDESTRLQTRIDTLTVELQAARTQIADNNAVISDQARDLAARHDMVATDASAKARWDTMATEAQSKSSMLAIRVVILEAEVNAAKSEARDYLASAEAQGQEIAAQSREIASLKARVENVKETLRIVDQNFAFAQTEITRLEDEKHRLERRRANDDIRADGTTARKSIRLSRDSAAIATAMDTVGDITAKDDEITRLRASVEANATVISSKDSIIADYSTQIGDLTQRLTAMTRDLETTNQALATTKARLKSANDLTQKLNGELLQAQANEASIRKIDNDLATKHAAFVHSTHLVFGKMRDNTGTYLADAFKYCIGHGIFAKENLYVTGLPEYADPVG